ncbi:MAG: YHYH protein [Candidatus Poseidoniales archaeon]|nr:YHYH protein [Candidatus Poseidoniales archaeon]
MADDDGVARSLFLAGLMIVSVMVGILFFDVQKEGENLAPVIEGDIPTNILIGSIDSLSLSITDEEMIELTLSVSLDGIEIQHQMDTVGNLIIDISQLGIGSHAVKIVATDSIGQESRWSATFMIEYPDEGYTVIVVSSNEITVERGNSTTASGVLVHQSMDTCNLEWSDGDIAEFSLNLPYDEDGRFNLGFSNIQENLTITVRGTCGTWVDSRETEVFNITVTEPAAEPEPTRGCTDPEASNYDEDAEEDDGSCEYDEEPEPVVETGSEEWWDITLLCDDTDVGFGGGVDDYNTSGFDNHVCDVSYVIEDGNITISTNGLPNHDFHSGPGCCASQQDSAWVIPLEPTNDSMCNPSVSSDGCTMAPDRGAIAFAVNGVAIYGPEDGPGGDAVAGHEGAYEEDRQEIWLGLCLGHSGPGGEYHYHADGNCIHWHPEGEQTWLNYSIESSRTVTEHSPIIGFALDGYSIYGFVGWDEDEEVSEMTSSYRLKDGETGYNGIDDYEYVAELGDLDSCNGHYAATPDWPEGIYHYHSTWENGEGGIGFPYFINCYRGELSSGGEDDPCAGHGETWGPGIGPPPDDCNPGPPPGGQSTEGLSLIALPSEIIPPNGGSIIAMLAMAVIMIRGLASVEVALDRVGITRGYRPNPE